MNLIELQSHASETSLVAGCVGGCGENTYELKLAGYFGSIECD